MMKEDLDMMNQNLDLTHEDFQRLLDKGISLVMRQFEQMYQQKAYHAFPPQDVAQWFDEPVPHKGMDLDELLGEVKEKVMDTATGNLGPHMYAYVMAGGTQVSIVAEQLAATINQNVTKWHLAPILSEIEKRVVKWGAEMMGIPGEVGGVFTSGGSSANLAGLTVARNIFFERKEIRKKGLFGQNPFRVYASKEVHGCVDKSLELLGIGTDHLCKVDTNADYTINLEMLEAQILSDLASGFQPFCIVGTAGTVNTGAIDDLVGLHRLAKKYDLWFHIDGAYGGLVAGLDSLKEAYKGIELADSLAVDFHKWLYQPFEAGCLIVKDWQTLRRAYFKQADYLDTSLETDEGRLDFNEHYFQLSRNAKAFKVWMSLKAYGSQAMKGMIQKDIDLAQYLADRVEEAPDFELQARSDLAIACFRYTGDLTSESDIIDLNERLIPALEADGRVFITGTRLKGTFALRACLINHRKTEATTDYLLAVIREVGQKIRKSS